jgi:hypothetical protein
MKMIFSNKKERPTEAPLLLLKNIFQHKIEITVELL